MNYIHYFSSMAAGHEPISELKQKSLTSPTSQRVSKHTGPINILHWSCTGFSLLTCLNHVTTGIHTQLFQLFYENAYIFYKDYIFFPDYLSDRESAFNVSLAGLMNTELTVLSSRGFLEGLVPKGRAVRTLDRPAEPTERRYPRGRLAEPDQDIELYLRTQGEEVVCRSLVEVNW